MQIDKPSTKPEKATRTTVDTIQFDRKTISELTVPGCQRHEKINANVRNCADQIRTDGGVVPGVMTLAKLKGDARTYLLDGLQRRNAFLLSGMDIGYADVRICYFDDKAEMGREFDRLNSHLVSMTPDDHLRALEDYLEPLASIRRRCAFVGYDHIRRGDKNPIVSMSLVLRAWAASSKEVPAGGGASKQLAYDLTQEDADALSTFLLIAHAAWGRDPEYFRLWGSLNLVITMWLYRRTVLTQYSHKTPRLTAEGFTKCLMSVSANGLYLSWLQGRHLGERDRSPCYDRIRQIVVARIHQETGKRVNMPAPEWFGSSNVSRRTGT